MSTLKEKLGLVHGVDHEDGAIRSALFKGACLALEHICEMIVDREVDSVGDIYLAIGRLYREDLVT